MESHIIVLLLYLIAVTANPCDTRQKTAFPHEDDCRKYYFCRRGIQVEQECPTGHNFDIDTNTCRIAFLAKCNRREIPTISPCPFSSTTENPRPYCNDTSKIILLTDPEDCQYFYICIWGDRVHRKCLNNWYFSVSKLICLPEHKADCAEPTTTTTEKVTTEETTPTTISVSTTIENTTPTTNLTTTTTDETIPTTISTITTTEKTIPTTITTKTTTEKAIPTTITTKTTTEKTIPTTITTKITTEKKTPTTNFTTTTSEETILTTIFITTTTREDTTQTTNFSTMATEDTIPSTITTTTIGEETTLTTKFTTMTTEETIPTTITKTTNREDTTPITNFSTMTTEEISPITISTTTTSEDTTPNIKFTTMTKEETNPSTITTTTTRKDTTPTTKFTKMTTEETIPTTISSKTITEEAIPTTLTTTTTTEKITPTVVFTTTTPENTTHTTDFTTSPTEEIIPKTIATTTTKEKTTPTKDFTTKSTEDTTPTVIFTTTTPEDISATTATEDTSPSTTTTTTTDKTIPTIATTTTTRKSTPTTIYPTTPSDYLRCGRRDNWLKPDYTDCRYYYLCLFGYSYHQTCPQGLLFSPTLMKCQLQETVDCTITTQDVTLLPDTKRTTKCGNDSWLKPDDNDCRYYYHCKDGYINKKKCPENFLFSQSSQICIDKAVADCYKSNNTFNEQILEALQSLQTTQSLTTITAIETKGSSTTTQQQQLECSVADLWIKPNPRNCSYYYFCVHGRLQLYACSTFSLFSPKELRCVDKNVADCLVNSADQIPFSDKNILFRYSSSAESDISAESLASAGAVSMPSLEANSRNIPDTPSESWTNTERVSITPFGTGTSTTGVTILPESNSKVGASTAPTESSAETKFTNIASEFSTESDSNINKELEPSVTEISTENLVKKENDLTIESSKRTEENVKEVPLYETEEKLREDCDSLNLWSKPDIGSCRHYYLCVYGELTHRQCPKDYEFNPVDLKCQTKQQAGCCIHLFTNVAGVITPDQFNAISERYAPSWTEASNVLQSSAIKCDDSSHMYRPDHNDCSKYYTCFYGILYIHSCPKGLEFSKTELMCLPPSKAKCNSICKTDGIYFASNPTDKTKYYICFNRNPIPQKCPQKICF